MGCDTLHSEEAMLRMWGDSVKAVKCQHARIHYDDFLLLMKGQTKDTPSRDEGQENFSMLGQGALLPVQEANGETVDESHLKGDMKVSEKIEYSRYEATAINATQNELVAKSNSQTSSIHLSPASPAKSIQTTPADQKKPVLDDDEFDTPLSMDDDFDITSAGPGVPGSAASLTPPMSPSRGAQDYATPGCNRLLIDFTSQDNLLSLPGLPSAAINVTRPNGYVRGRSRSLDESEKEESKALHAVADVVRDMLLPETDHAHVNMQLEEVVKDESKSALVVNRKLYRAHRHMRLAVLDASKRFEEQQAEHAKQTILAAREAEGQEDEKGMGMIQAGLVMRHGHTKQVSSKAIRKVLEENRSIQQVLVEKANRRGGRGRRSRKKTTSDMSGFLSSMGQDDMTMVAIKAACPDIQETSASSPEELAIPEVATDVEIEVPELHPAEGPSRAATVPGDFRKTSDPFGSHGKYGAIVPTWE